MDTHYTLLDVLDHNDALDLKIEAERMAHERLEEKMSRGRNSR
jgi:hypothetical protein